MAELRLYLKDEAATVEAGQDIAFALAQNDIVYLIGDLGVGKTCLARAIIRQIVDLEIEVPSPTFSLVQTYEGSETSGITSIIHGDLYRVSDSQEVIELGLEQIETGQLVLVEWPENGGEILAKPSIELSLKELDAGRELTILASKAIIAKFTRSFAIRKFLDENWQKDIFRKKLFGDASARSYEIVSDGATQRILMNSPKQADGPIIKDGKPYSQIAHLAEDISSFVGVQKILESAELSVPTIHGADLDKGFLLLENLGSGAIIDSKRNPIKERYLASSELLAEFHNKKFESSAKLSNGNLYQVPEYSMQALHIETELLLDWYAPRFAGSDITKEDRDLFSKIWEKLFANLGASEKHLVLRDFHSPNIIWLDERPSINKVGLIDFQDAVIGPTAYDVASLAQDARVDISVDLEKDIVDHYLLRRISKNGFNKEAFLSDYAIMAAQRATKILGIFVRLDERDGKSAYLKHLPRMQDYIARSLKHPVLSDYREWFARVTKL